MSLLGARLGRLVALPVAVARPRASLEALVPARESPYGVMHLVEKPLALPALDAEALRALALTDVPLDTTRPFFFDTETTGLMGGTGTLAFLLGTASVEGLTQVHLPGPGAERPMLTWLADQLERATVVISFNGKSFDWPLLRARFVMNRLSPPREVPHVDLLHCARRVFRHHLETLTLGALERRVLGVSRVGDIDGAQIPAAWFDFLRTGRVATLGKVLAHNERDVRSMVDLVVRLIAAWNERLRVLPPTALGLAQVAMRAGDEERASRFLSLATAAEGAWQAWSLKAELHRRQGRFQEAVEALEVAVGAGGDDDARLHLRLARLYEHRLKDREAALRHAEKCAPAERPDAHARRLTRPSPAPPEGERVEVRGRTCSDATFLPLPRGGRGSG